MNQLVSTRIQRLVFVGLVLFFSSHEQVVTSQEIVPASFENEIKKRTDFQREIRPLLAERCFQCHGPDQESRESDLRLDLPPGADSETTEIDYEDLIDRVASDDPDFQMPPPGHGKPVSEPEVEQLRQWVSEGAYRTRHWAFVAPQRPKVPTFQTRGRIENAIDSFVLEKLQDEGLRQAPPASRAIWLRRLSLDLTGLPPTNEQVDAFVADTDEGAEARQIERLLLLPHFGERWGRMWLDGARYADSDGYGKDKPRTMWYYRDWVVKALNRDMAYDQFIMHQLAGDLVEDADQASIVATGFLRNSMIPNEGGADPEEYRMKAMFDRMDAVGKSILGLSIECAQCHAHKTDPISQQDYYAMMACINNTDEVTIPVYSDREERLRQSLLDQVKVNEELLLKTVKLGDGERSHWEQEINAKRPRWKILDPGELPFEGTKYRELEDHSILAEGYAPKFSETGFSIRTDVEKIGAIRLELLTHPELPRSGPGRSLRGAASITEFKAFIAPIDEPQNRVELKFKSAWSDVNPVRKKQPRYLPHSGNRKLEDPRTVGPIEFAIDGDQQTAWTTDTNAGQRNRNCTAVFNLVEAVEYPGGCIITFQPIQTHGGWNNHGNHCCQIGRFRFSLTGDNVENPLSATVEQLLEIPTPERDSNQQLQAWRAWRANNSIQDIEIEELETRIASLWRQYPEGTNQFVLGEKEKNLRTTSVLARGDFQHPVEKVQPGILGCLHQPVDDFEQSPSGISRMAFAKWLVDRRSPTVARAIVNRIWQEYFGQGIQETPGDFGVQSPPPSHQELLDWLAVELMDNDWKLKHIHRLIVSSATYRQSGNFRVEAQAIDPGNRLLSRGPRGPVSAEMVRDISLSVSGLLNPEVGGPPVYPPIPKHLLQRPVTYSPRTWPENKDANRYRRALYTFRYRSAAYPLLETFDAPAGFVSCVKRNRSNTPMQSLILLNGPLMMECAWALSEMAVQRDGEPDEQRLAWMMKRCVSREPDKAEVKMLVDLLQSQRQKLKRGEIDHLQLRCRLYDGRAAQRKVVKDGRVVPIKERVAWMLVARALLSLDETISKP